MEQMYKGIPFSPTATLTANIAAADTIIPVSDVDAFPDAPNIATIGSIAGPNETIIYTGKTTTSLTGCTRGVEGTASDWAVDELIGRNFTAKDHADMVKNIEELENNKLDATYKVDVVNTADVTIAGKALDAKQNNPSITGTLAQKVTSNARQIDVLNTLTKSIAVNLTGKSLVDYAKSLNVTDKVNIQINGATDTPAPIWYYVEITVHCQSTKYINIMLYSIAETETKVYSGSIVNGTFTRWKLLSEVSGEVGLTNGWSHFEPHQPCKVSRIGNRCFLSGLARKGLTDSGTVILAVPPFFRPTATTNVITHDAYGFYIGTSGNLTLSWHRFANTDEWYSFDGLSWEVE